MVQRAQKQTLDQPDPVEGELLTMVRTITEMTRRMSKCLVGLEPLECADCQARAREIRKQGKDLTCKMGGLGSKGDLPRGLIRFPLSLTRIGEELERIVACCRIKEADSIELSHKAEGELGQLLAILLDLLENLRTVIVNDNSVLLEYILCQCQRVSAMLDGFKSAHWSRLENGHCVPEAGSLYLNILDSLKSSSEYVEHMATALLGPEDAPPSRGAGRTSAPFSD